MSPPACRDGNKQLGAAVNVLVGATRWLPAEELKRNADVYRQCVQLHRRCCALISRLRNMLLRMAAAAHGGKGVDVNDLAECVDEVVLVSGALGRLRSAVSQSGADKSASSAVLAYKAQWWRGRVWQDRVTLLHLALALLTEALGHCGNQPDWPGWTSILRLVSTYNELLGMGSGSAGEASVVGVCRNTCPTLQHPLRKVSLTRILQLLAQQRAEKCCHQLVEGLLVSYKPLREPPAASSTASLESTLTPASPESPGSPASFIDVRRHNRRDEEDNSSMEIFRALTHHMSPPHGPHTQATQRSDLLGLTPVASDSACVRARGPSEPLAKRPGPGNGNGHADLSAVERLLDAEDTMLSGLLHAAVEHAPHLLGTGGVKASRTSGVKRPRGCVRRRAEEYYQQLLWGEVGCVVEHVLLWWGWADGRGQPIGAESPEYCHHLRAWLLKLSTSPVVPALCLGALQSLVDSLGVHITSTSWDALFRRSMVAAGHNHSRQPIQDQPDLADLAGAQGTSTGRLFSTTLADLVDLSNACEGDGPASSSPMLDEIETLPLVEQIPLLHRLDHSVHTVRLWAAARARLLAGSWAVGAFFLVSQRDVANCLMELNRLKLRDHGDLPTTASVHVTVCSRMRAKLVSEVRENIAKLKRVPEESIAVMASVCRTVSLATLHMVFPELQYWRQHGEMPEYATGYVEEFLERVLKPVLTACSLLTSSVQHTVGGLVLRIMCEAWLDHIYMHRIKFSEWGALQLLTDFGAVPTWLTERVNLPADVRNSLLRHEVLRRCEGVGRLLLRRPGERVAMSGPGHTSHARHGDQESAGAPTDHMPAEMYVPNQEQWLELRAPRNQGICAATLCCGLSAPS